MFTGGMLGLDLSGKATAELTGGCYQPLRSKCNCSLRMNAPSCPSDRLGTRVSWKLCFPCARSEVTRRS